jgi:hypothetical protein
MSPERNAASHEERAHRRCGGAQHGEEEENGYETIKHDFTEV